MNILGIGAIVEGVGKIAGDLITSDEERLQILLEERKIESGERQGRMAVNKQEAAHKSIFVAGWRPFIGWVGGLAMAYQFLLYPLMTWGWVWFKAKGWIPPDALPPPVFDSGQLFAVITGMLGIGGMRSFDKMKKTQTDSIRN